MASEVIKLNLIPKGEMPVFHCSQFDNGRLINIELYRGEDAYTIPEGCTAELHCRKVDGNIITIGSPVVDENTIKFTSTTQLTACNGKNLCEVAILGADDYLIGSLNFWLEVELDPLKGGINSTSEIHDLYEQIEEITAEVIGNDYYDKTAVDNLLDDKADKSNTYTKTQVDTLLTAKADKSNVYTKAETTTLLAAKADADNVYTKAQVETKLAAKANANAVYSKVEVDAMVDDLEDAIDLKADAATTYTKTEIDAALALKANAADVYTKQEIDNKFLDIMPIDTAGPASIASFDTDLAVNLVDVKTTLTPSLTGYATVNLTRCGVNLWDEIAELGTIDDTTGQNNDDNTRLRSKNYISCLPNTIYYVKKGGSGNIKIFYYDANKNFISFFGWVAGNTTITTPENAYFIRFVLATQYGTTYNNDISINYPATDTTYHPYTGNAYAIALGDTYYGGSANVTEGTGLSSYGYLANLGSLEWHTDGAGYCQANLTGIKTNPVTTTKSNILCDQLTTDTQANVYGKVNDNTISGATTQTVRVYMSSLTGMTDAQVKTALTGYKIVYELATSTSFTFTPVQIAAIVGQNNVFSDTGDTTVKYKEGIQHYIDKKVIT